MSIELEPLLDGHIADAVPVMTNLERLRSAIEAAATGASVGDLRLTALPVVEAGWLVCDGSAVSRATYATLFAAIGTAYGEGDKEHTFNLPDYRERVPVGAAGAIARGAKGGEATHVLSAGEMPAHVHGPSEGLFVVEGVSFPTHVGTGGGSNWKFVPNTSSAGGGAAHNNMQPYTCCSVWIKH